PSRASDPPGPPDQAQPGSGADDLDVECGADLGMQADRDLVRTNGLDRVAYLDPALVQTRAACRADRVGDVRRPHRAEQPPAGAGPGLAPAMHRRHAVGPIPG